MKFTISKDDILLGLQRVQNVVERRTTMPILSNALLKTEESKIALAATDLEVGIQSLLPATVKEDGAITVKARSLLDIVREMPETNLSFETKEGNHLIVKAKKSVFNILGLPSDDFPDIPGFTTLEDSVYVRMNGEATLSMLDKTLYAASNDEARYHLNGVFFETIEQNEKNRHFRMVATDAHRLSLVEDQEALFDENAWKLFKDGVIVPRKGLQELRRLLSEGKEDFFITIRGKMLLVKRENIFLSMRLIEGKYADYRRIIPEPKEVPLTLRRDTFLASLKRIALMSTDKSRSITFNLQPGSLRLTSQSPELGDAEEELSVDYEGSPMKIGFNSRYLIDALSTVESEDVLFEIRGNQHPGVLRSTDGTNHTSVVMPMRI